VTWFGWALLSALFAAITALLAKLGVRELDANLATAIRTSVVVALSWGIVAVSPVSGALSSISRSAWLFLILSGAATGLSWVCYFHAIQSGPLSRVAPIDKLSVVLTVAFGALFLGEPLTPKALSGAVFIVTGVIILAFE